jgi:c-di-GMP-binding flagellar brake protein YcgR
VIERRVHPRVLVEIDAEFQVEGSSVFQKGTIRDLSAGGMGLLTPEPLEPQTVLERLRFSVPEEDETLPPIEIEVEAVVLRCAETFAQEEAERYRSGIHFLTLHGEPFEQVRRFVYGRL